jgi:SAM-dependent methyltransferase
MPETNYQSKWWGMIYDQMMVELADWVDDNRRFYQAQLKETRGAVLECACGTGIFLLPFLQAGYDTYGFDISAAMLDTLRRKASALGIGDIARRISVQNMETFSYAQRFEAILIPTNSFSMLDTQEAQIRALRQVYTHLALGGRLLLDLRLAGVRTLAQTPEVEEGTWYTWTHPETGLPIRQRVVGRLDFDRQLVLDRCFIEYEGEAEDFLMAGRWIFREELQLLLRLAGFTRWQAFRSPEGEALVMGPDERYSYWVVEK